MFLKNYNMNILLTGANGFIGRSFRKLSAHKVYALKNGDEYKKNENEFSINLTNAEQVINFLKNIKGIKIDAIVHCAAVTPFSSKRELNYDHDLMMAENIVFIAENLNVKKILFTSGWNVYDPMSKVPFSEESSLLPCTDYGTSKLKVERYLKENGKRSMVINIRFASVYGPGQTSTGLIPNSVRSALDSHTITINSIETKRDYLYIDDAMDAVEKLLRLKIDKHLDINIGSNTSYSVKDVAETIKIRMKKRYDMSIKIIVNSHFVEAIPFDNRLDISKAQRLINFHPSTKLIDGLEQYIIWMRQKI